VPIELLGTCFQNFQIGHLRDDEGFVSTWYDKDDASSGTQIYHFSPGKIDDTLYFTTENYPLGVVPTVCTTGLFPYAMVAL